MSEPMNPHLRGATADTLSKIPEADRDTVRAIAVAILKNLPRGHSTAITWQALMLAAAAYGEAGVAARSLIERDGRT